MFNTVELFQGGAGSLVSDIVCQQIVHRQAYHITAAVSADSADFGGRYVTITHQTLSLNQLCPSGS